MKRQHPTDPNLFWCPKCQTYKEKGEFYLNCGKISAYCRECMGVFHKQQRVNNPDREKIYTKSYRERNHNKLVDRQRVFRAENPDKCKAYKEKHKKTDRYKATRNERQKRVSAVQRERLDPVYLAHCLRRTVLVLTPEIIKLEREAITIKRIERSMINELAG